MPMRLSRSYIFFARTVAAPLSADQRWPARVSITGKYWQWGAVVGLFAGQVTSERAEYKVRGRSLRGKRLLGRRHMPAIAGV